MYVQTDSNNDATLYGVVLERDEVQASGLTYNNIAGLRLSGQTTTMAETGALTAQAILPGTQTIAQRGVSASGNYSFTIYLPLVMRNYVYVPGSLPTTSSTDLTVDRITVLTDTVRIVLRNTGTVSVTDDFWVDLYINPSAPPTHVNQPWQELSAQGAVWGVTAPVIPLRPGEAVTLTVDDLYYWYEYSKLAPGVWAALLAGNPPPPLPTTAMSAQSAAPTIGSLGATHNRVRPPNQLPTRR